MSLLRTKDHGRPGSSFQGLATGKEFYLESQRDAGTPCLKPPCCEIWPGRSVSHSLVFRFQPERALTDRLGLGEQPRHRESKSLPATQSPNPMVVRVITTKQIASRALQPSMCLNMTAGRATKRTQPNRMKMMVEMMRILVWLTFHFWKDRDVGQTEVTDMPARPSAVT